MIGLGFCNYRQDRGRAWSLNHLILKNTFRVILFEPFIAGRWSCKHLEMVTITNLLVRPVDKMRSFCLCLYPKPRAAERDP